MSDNYYTILGVSRDADEREIKRAYHKMARELHPDKAETPEKARDMEQKFALVSTAYNLLKDTEARREYDRKTFGESKAPTAKSDYSAPVSESPRGVQPAMAPVIPEAPKAPRPAGSSGSPAPTIAKPVAGEEVSAGRQAIAQKACAKGLQLMKAKEFLKAAEFFEAAITNNPNEAIYYAKYAMALIEARKSGSRAIEAAKKAIELDRYNIDYKFTLATIYMQIGSTSNAVTIYEDILKWDKENKAARQMLRTLNKTGSFLEKFEEASPIFKSIAGLFKKKDDY